MPKKDFMELILEAHRRGQKKAIEDSIRTGVPMVVMKRGKIVEVPPKYKYVKVPIKAKKK
jgi:hypothetical protein